MKILAFLIAVFVLITSGCGNEAKLLESARACQKAIDLGLLEVADEHCTNALGAPDADVLDADVKSERLFILGSVKRQLGLFVDAEPLIKKSLTIEKSLSKPEAKRVAYRNYELSLIMAGQGKWQEGAEFLHKVLSEVTHFSDAEQRSIKNMTKQYISGLVREGQLQLAGSLEVYVQQTRN